MEQANKTQVMQEAKIFNELWAFLKKYYNVTVDAEEEVWNEIISEADRIADLQTPYTLGEEKDGRTFARMLTLTVVEYLEQMAKTRGDTDKVEK